MLTRNQIKFVKTLSRKKERKSQQRFVAEGRKVVEEALLLGLQPEILCCRPSLENLEIFQNAFVVNEETMGRMSALSSPSDALAVFPIPPEKPLEFEKNKCYLALDGISDPGNLGTILRIADWFGLGGVCCSEQTVDAYNPKVVQASMGSLLRVPLIYGDLPSILSNADLPVIGASMEGKSIWDLESDFKGILVIGSESHGLSDEIRNILDFTVSIPGNGGAESLNAAVATGILVGILSGKS